MALARLLSHTLVQPVQILAARLGTTSESVGQGIAALRALGVDLVESAEGLRLAAPLDLLDAVRLHEFSGGLHGVRVELLDECASTNAQLVTRTDAPGGMALVCEHQSAGRGRRGHAWTSGLGASLTFSLLWRFALPPAALSGLPLAVAVIAAEELEHQGCAGIALKWPNDLLHQGCKLGGILIETTRPSGPHETACIIGIGINVRLPSSLADRIERPVTDLAAVAKAQGQSVPDRTTLLAGLLRALAARLPRYEAQGLPAFREAWLRRHAHQGRQVMLVQDERVLVEGEAQGIAEDGALLVRTAKGLERVLSGEVSLREQAGPA